MKRLLNFHNNMIIKTIKYVQFFVQTKEATIRNSYNLFTLQAPKIIISTIFKVLEKLYTSINYFCRISKVVIFKT